MKVCLFCKNILLTKNIKFCDNKCQQKYLYEEKVNFWKLGEELGVVKTANLSVKKFIRKYLFEKNKNSCQVCGWSKVNQFTNKIPLDIHHIDGNPFNNKEENLQLLCKNCHSLTENYGSRNDSKRTFCRN